MLINTVILFIRDTLPIFLLFSILLSQRHVPLRALLAGLTGGLLLTGLLYRNLGMVSELFDGGGLELSKTLLLIVVFLGLCGFIYAHMAKRLRLLSVFAILLIGAITLVNAIHFFIYSVAYWSSQQADMALMMGTVIGLGISSSVSVLLYLFLDTWQRQRGGLLVLAIFLAGQIAGVAVLLEQINVLSEQSRLWNTSGWLADESEYGHFLNVLFGYEATPGIAYVLVYLFALIFPFVFGLILSKRAKAQRHQGRCA